MSFYKFQALYEVQDGYVGGSRHQSFFIDEADIEDDMDEAALRELFGQSMQSAFEQSIYPAQVNEDKFVKWAQDVLKAREE